MVGTQGATRHHPVPVEAQRLADTPDGITYVASGGGHAPGRRNTWIAEAPDVGEDPVVSLIVPTLNEAENLPYVLRAIPPIVDEVIIVDGGSTDGTVEIARSLRPDAVVITDERRGKGRALRTGYEHATGDILVIIDADGSMDPAEISALVGALRAGADMVKGSRFLQGADTDDMGPLRQLGNSALCLLVRTAFGGRFSDLCYGYLGFWRHVLPVFDGEADGFEVEAFINVRALAAGLRIAEIPSFEHRRIHGASKLNTFRDGWRVFGAIVGERRALTRRRGLGVHRPVEVATRRNVAPFPADLHQAS